MSLLPWLPSETLGPAAMRAVREAMIFECCKWDPQVGDTDVLCPSPLVLRAEAFAELTMLAEKMYSEVMGAERAILGSSRALGLLGLPGPLCRALRVAGGSCTTDARVMRFDFHATDEGWKVSEVNSDVPGGYIETKGFSETMAPHLPGLVAAGDPVRALIEATLPAARVAMVHATAYTDDRQVMVYLARHLAAAGRQATLLAPDKVSWKDGCAYSDTGESFEHLFRFFPAEWLPNLGWFSGWRDFVRGGQSTSQMNPPSALVTQSKRFPLACELLGLDLPTWDSFVPETRDPRALGDLDDARWVLKPALGRVGENVGLRGVSAAAEWQKICLGARRHPDHWAAQRRFEAVPWQIAGGVRYPCLGVYVINGKASGIYGRAAARPLVDAQSQDVAVLVAAPASVSHFSQ